MENLTPKLEILGKLDTKTYISWKTQQQKLKILGKLNTKTYIPWKTQNKSKCSVGSTMRSLLQPTDQKVKTSL